MPCLCSADSLHRLGTCKRHDPPLNALCKRLTLAVARQDKASGKRIMGMTPQNSIATVVASKPHALWAVPEYWTLAQGATVPVAYATAYDALVVRGRLQPHHRVLIHSATGAVGLAATRISLNRGCEVRPCCLVWPCPGPIPADCCTQHNRIGLRISSQLGAVYDGSLQFFDASLALNSSMLLNFRA